MSSIDLKNIVADALGAQWDGFCTRHPNLSRVIDRDIMIEQYTHDLRSDPEFSQAMRQVESAGLSNQSLQDLAGKIIGLWLKLI